MNLETSNLLDRQVKFGNDVGFIRAIYVDGDRGLKFLIESEHGGFSVRSYYEISIKR